MGFFAPLVTMRRLRVSRPRVGGCSRPGKPLTNVTNPLARHCAGVVRTDVRLEKTPPHNQGPRIGPDDICKHVERVERNVQADPPSLQIGLLATPTAKEGDDARFKRQRSKYLSLLRREEGVRKFIYRKIATEVFDVDPDTLVQSQCDQCDVP